MIQKILPVLLFISLLSYQTNGQCGCTSDQELDPARSECSEQLAFIPSVTMTEANGIRMITANSIPDHLVGIFGGGMGMGGPNSISEQSEEYEINAEPELAAILTPLLSTTGTGPNAGPQYSFGVLLNGVELDPVAAEPFPHTGGFMNPNVNWEWNLEALNIRIGLDCNNAHVQPTGKYHYHGSPTLYLESLNISAAEMTMIGYAADGFPVYYKYAYTDPANENSEVVPMTSSYQLKEGCRPGDGEDAPCDLYNGVYTNDYEYVEGLGTLDEANGRSGVTSEFPQGTYYYVITDEFPSIPRFFRGTPSTSFRIGPNAGQGSCLGIDGGDRDNDGICKIDDCNDFDAGIGAKQPVGSICDDNNSLTVNDQVQSDGCNCMGTLSTATDNELDATVRIYPNPVNDLLYILVDGTDSYRVTLYSTNGKVILLKANVRTIATDDLPACPYFVKIEDTRSGDYLLKSVVKE